MEKKRAVTILLHNENGDILAVSRKNDETDMGLPGGKCDEGETDVEAIIREVKEETGLDVFQVQPYFERHDSEYICTTFIGNYKGTISTTEKGKVIWTDWETIKKGSFGEYNQVLEQHFKKYHKFKIGDVLMNPATSEMFMILMNCYEAPTLNGIDFGTMSGYLVRAVFSETGYSFVKKTALDDVRMLFTNVKTPVMTSADGIAVLPPDVKLELDLIEAGFIQIDKKSGQAFACKSHFDVNQYYGEDDKYLYSFHLKDVVNIGKRFKYLIPEEDWQFVENGLWNHDVIEDARKTFNDLKKEIGEKGALISFALTNSDGKTREERAGDLYYEKIRNTKYATFAKLCDRIANMEYSKRTGSSMYKKYKKEFDNFKMKLYVENEYEPMWSYLSQL